MTPANIASRVEDVLAERTKHDEVIAWRVTGVRFPRRHHALLRPPGEPAAVY